MAVYVDDVRQYPISMIQPAARRYGNLWSHLTADTDEELHNMAARLGLPRRHAQHMDSVHQWLRHYDIVPSKRHQAVRFGAIQVDEDPNMRAWVRERTRERRRLAQASSA